MSLALRQREKVQAVLRNELRIILADCFERCYVFPWIISIVLSTTWASFPVLMLPTV